MTNFDNVHSRLNTNSVKWDSIATTYKEEGLLPLWVADMDFLAPKPVKNALQQVIAQGIYGYTVFPESLYEAIISWQERKHNYSLQKEEILFNSGVVPSLALAVQSYK